LAALGPFTETVKLRTERLFSVTSLLELAPEVLDDLAKKIGASRDHFHHDTFADLATCAGDGSVDSGCSRFNICDAHNLRFDHCKECKLTVVIPRVFLCFLYTIHCS